MAEENNYTLYLHISPKGKRYVGITCLPPEQRWKYGGRGYDRNTYFWNAIKKYGWDNFQHKILATNLSKEEAELAEIKCIKHWHTQDPQKGYNICRGGGTTRGFHHSLETREKLSKQKLGKHLSLTDEQRRARGDRSRGHIVTEDTRRKISEANKGRIVSEETRRKLSEINKGKKLSEETKRKMAIASTGHKHTEEDLAKMRKAQKGHFVSEETKRKISDAKKGKMPAPDHWAAFQAGCREALKKQMRPVWCEETACEYESMLEAARVLGICQESVWHCCHGTYKTNSTHGYHLRFLEHCDVA